MEDPPTMEELKRENDAMRKQIQELKDDVDAKTRSLQEERENRVSVVRDAREEERANIRAEMEELKQKMTSDNLRKMDAVRDETMQKAKQEMEIYQQMKDKEVETKVRQLKEKMETKITLEQKVARATEELVAKHEAEMKKLHAAMFELESAREDAKTQMENAVAADKKKAEEIRRLRDEHEKDMRKASQDSRSDNKKQFDEIKELQRKLSSKDRELVSIQEKSARVEMEKEQLEDKLKRMKEAEAWEKMSPRSSVSGEPFSPFGRKYTDHEKEVMVRNSELSYLARSLQEKNKALEEEKKQFHERAESAELLNKPLQDKVEKLLKKIDQFTATKSTLERKITALGKESVDLRTAKQELEGEVERQKRTFQRQLMEARTRNTSVTQMKGDLLSAEAKTEELTKEIQKLKEVNQRRTKDLGRLRKELSGVKRQRDSLAERLLLDTPPSPALSKGDDEYEEGSGSLPSLTEGDAQSDGGKEEELVAQSHVAASEHEKQQEPQSLGAQEEPKVAEQDRGGDAAKVEQLQARVDELEYFIMEQDEVKKRMKEQYEREAEQARLEQDALKEELQQRATEAIAGGNDEERDLDLQKESEAEEMKAKLSALQDTMAEREETLEKYQKLIVVLKARLQEASPSSSTSSLFPEPHQLESYISDLEESETKLREIYEELLNKPLFLAKENQRLQEELQEAREAEEELNEDVNQMEEKLNAVEAEKEEKIEELNEVHKWLDDNQPALMELGRLKDDLHIARRRIDDLEGMQEDLLNKVEEQASSDVPPALPPKPRSRRASRRESEVLRQSGTKAIERSITVVEHVQATVLELRQKMLLTGVLKEDGTITPPGEEEPITVQDEGTGTAETGESGDETRVEVQETATAQIDIGTEMSNLTEQLAQQLQNLMQMKEDVAEEKSPPPIVEESMTMTTVIPVSSDVPPRETDDGQEDLDAKASKMASDVEESANEYEMPRTAARKQERASTPSGGDLDHPYAEIGDRQQRVSGVYDTVEFQRQAKKDPTTAEGEVEVEPMIEEEPKEVWSAHPDFDSFEKELEELRDSVREKEEQLKLFEENEQRVAAELATLAPENEKMKVKLRELEEREAAVTKTMVTYEGQLKDYQRCLSELNDKMDSADVEKQRLESDKFDLETKLGENEELLGDASQLVPTLHKKIEKLVTEGETWKNQYNTLLEQLPDLTDTSDKERAEELERELEIWKEKFEELSQKAASVNKELLAKLQSRTAHLQKELDQRAEEIVQLQAQLNPADNDLAKERSIRGSRVFVALFDYDPAILCHTGHPGRELEFMEGDILEVLGGMDESGFYHAALNGASGLVPVNFVEEVDVRDPSARSRLYNQRMCPVEVDRTIASPTSIIEEVVGEEEEFLPSFTAAPFGESPDGPASLSVAPGNKPQPPRQVKVVDAFPNGIALSWQPPPKLRHGSSQISGYLIAVGEGNERHVPGHTTTMLSIPSINYTDFSSLRLCTVTKEGVKSDWVTVSVGRWTTPTPTQLQGPPLSGSYAQGSLYDSLKLGQSAASPMNSFQEGVPIAHDTVPAANMYVVLYDYDPQTSSPNDEPSDELSLTTGDTVTVLEDMRDDGLVKAELKGKVGLVPFSFLEKAKKPAAPLHVPQALAPADKLPKQPKQPKQKMIAKYDYDPSIQSPNTDKETELSFRKGQLITVCGPIDGYGFFMGESGGKRGLVPSNFVGAVPA